ncbi:MAG TPA: ABC transporter ATP-binding protein [Hyphomicrobiaceae bacterium]|nr:ABC transporter ATP-binding protein [Hyphomicrobiaceae bacterium]
MTLSIEGLTVGYRVPGGIVTALSDVSLSVPKGRTLAVVGESGSGKSTVALAVMGLLASEAHIPAGRILYEGTDLLGLEPEARRRLRGARIALVFQDPFSVLNPALRIGEQVGEGLVHHKGFGKEAALARAIELLREVGIADAAAVANAYPHELSGGMRQRALIAGALAAEPDFLILDEPTTALDVTIEAQILDLLEELQKRRGLSMLFISHNLGVVRRIADDVAVLYAGEVVEYGRTSDVFERPLHQYTKGLLAAIPRLDARQTRLAAIPGRLPDLRRLPAGCRFEPRCPFAQAQCRAAQVLDEAGSSRAVRCIRAEELAATGWLAVDAPPPVSPRREPAAAHPVVAADRIAKTFTLTGGLAALAFDGWRPVMRPVRVRAIDGVSLAIARGEVLGLVGESGSGKTTLGRTILRLIDVDDGTIRIAGEDVTRTPQAALVPMRRIAQIVFQNPDSSLNPRKTAGEIIARPLQRFGIVPAGEIAARVRALLDLVRLPAHYADRYPHQMSGGEKQRIGIARAIATDPQFVVCDEPVSALDVSVQAAIVNLLADLRDRLDVAYLLISHDISVVAHLADRIAVMYGGRIVETGARDSVLAPPYHPYTEALLSAVPTVARSEHERIRLPLDARPRGRTAGCNFAGRCPRRIGTICDTVEPPLRALGPGHVIACHLPLGAEAAMRQQAPEGSPMSQAGSRGPEPA